MGRHQCVPGRETKREKTKREKKFGRGASCPFCEVEPESEMEPQEKKNARVRERNEGEGGKKAKKIKTRGPPWEEEKWGKKKGKTDQKGQKSLNIVKLTLHF